MTRWTRHLNDWPTWIRENCVHLFRTYGFLGNTWVFWSFRFHCLLSALLCGSNMGIQVSSSVSKLEITRLLQPLYVFKRSRAFKALCLLFLSEQMRYTSSANLSQVQTLFQNCLHTAFWYASTTSFILAISLTDNRATCSITIFTAAMLALVTEVSGLPGRVSSSTENFPALKSFNPPKNCTHWNGLRSIYTTQFIKYLLWSYIKPNAAFNIAMNFSLLVHVPM